jgi:hypothetical protein
LERGESYSSNNTDFRGAKENWEIFFVTHHFGNMVF